MKQPPKLLKEERCFGTPNYIEREWLVSRTETDEKITERIRRTITWNGLGEIDEFYGKEHSHTNTYTQKKFLCVNGPLKNTKVTEEEGRKRGYCPYNNASQRQEKPTPKVILVLFAD